MGSKGGESTAVRTAAQTKSSCTSLEVNLIVPWVLAQDEIESGASGNALSQIFRAVLASSLMGIQPKWVNSADS